MGKGKVALIGSIIILFVVTFLFIDTSLTKGETAESSSGNQLKQKEVEEMSSLLFQKDGFFEQIDMKLEEKGYLFQMFVVVYSKNNIHVKYILENQEATEFVQEEVTSIFYEVAEDNNYDSNSFNLKIGDHKDRSEW